MGCTVALTVSIHGYSNKTNSWSLWWLSHVCFNLYYIMRSNKHTSSYDVLMTIVFCLFYTDPNWNISGLTTVRFSAYICGPLKMHLTDSGDPYTSCRFRPFMVLSEKSQQLQVQYEMDCDEMFRLKNKSNPLTCHRASSLTGSFIITHSCRFINVHDVNSIFFMVRESHYFDSLNGVFRL